MRLFANRMIILRQTVFRQRHLAMLALVLAFALRALIPQGMMVGPDAGPNVGPNVGRSVAVLLCDGSGIAAAKVVVLGEKPGKTQSARDCPFAVLAHAGTDDAPTSWIVALPFAPERQDGGRAVISTLRPEHAIQPPARAPPVAA